MINQKISRLKVLKQMTLIGAALLPSFKIILAQDKTVVQDSDMALKTGYGQGGYGTGLYNNNEDKNTI
jgi:hypothetical protein